jgi:hypothetical protein
MLRIELVKYLLHKLIIFDLIQNLVIEELDLVFSESDRPVTVQDLTQLKYMERCIKETLRMYPPLTVAARCLTEEVQVGMSVLIPRRMRRIYLVDFIGISLKNMFH